MKLYATVASERATKGQGGNEYLRIELMVGSADMPERIGIIELRNEEDAYELVWHDEDPLARLKLDKSLRVLKRITKGNKQKGECSDCKRQGWCDAHATQAGER